MAGILDKIRWQEFPIGVTSAIGTTNLLAGEFGCGRPRGSDHRRLTR